MKNLENLQRMVTGKNRTFPDPNSTFGWNKAALAIGTILTLAIGTFFLVSYPLHTMIVMLFMASVLFLDRG